MSFKYGFHHPNLGILTGILRPETPDVVEFRAIPYATLPGRFKHSILRKDLESVSRDFARQGYASPHTFSTDDVHSGGPYPGAEAIETDEFRSLILQVNVPLKHLDAMDVGRVKKLPVLTYIHGGGFVLGNIDAQHNTAYMTQHSLSISKPVITVSLQYRLGALGFMATPDGGKNFALRDQRNALLWIQRFIAGFGGDKSRHTLFGESAGGWSICCHMLSHAPPSGPLFNRAIIMSGVVVPEMAPQAQSKARKAFEKICEDLGIDDKGEAAIDQLRSLDVQKLVEASDKWKGEGNSWMPVEDEEWFKEKVTWDRVPELLGKCEWVDDLIMGTTGFEGQMHLSVANLLTPESFLEHLKLQLSDKAVKKVMQMYGVTLGMDQNLFLTLAMQWMGDVTFNAPTHAVCRYLATNTNKRVYRYIFDVRNPFPNAPFYQQAHHWVDVYFVFRAMQFRFPHQYLKDLSDKHAQLWIEFANGEAPWKEYSSKDAKKATAMIADERDGWVERTEGEHDKLGSVEFAQLDKLWDAWGEKKGEAWLPLDYVALKHAIL